MRPAPRIRSILRVVLPKFFDAETYIWNHCSSADAVLVDMRNRDDLDKGERRRQVLLKALDKGPYKPRIYMEPTSRRIDHDIFIKDMATCSHPQMHGFLMRIRDGDVIREVESVLGREGQMILGPHRTTQRIVPPHNKNASLLVDIERQTIPYAVFKYHNFGVRREGGWNHLADLVKKAKASNVMSIAWRARPSTSVRELVREMEVLKELGFSGMMLYNSDLIDTANKIFS
ncbi:hypothetical protein Q1695_012319 [Nippostrongylus brasiliensis]|nr:hypothetical protein Q1695_012319 [Nippostrongylus brasiliensis]